MPDIYKVTFSGYIGAIVPFVTTHYFHASTANVEQDNRNSAELLQNVVSHAIALPSGQNLSLANTLLKFSSVAAVMYSVSVQSLWNPFDFAETAVEIAGEVGETPEGTAASYLFCSNRVRRDIGRAKRYIPAVVATAFNTNTLSNVFRPAAIDIAYALSYPQPCTFPSGSAGNAEPVVLGSRHIPDTENPREYERYGSYAEQAPHMYNAIFDGNGAYPKLAWLRGRAR